MYLTVLWTEGTGRDHADAFDIKQHKELQEAVLYLVKNGAKFDNQEIVKKVDWMPKDDPSSTQRKPDYSQSHEPEVFDPGPPPGTVNGPAEQPTIINGNSTQSGPKKSMFDNIIPPHLRKGM